MPPKSAKETGIVKIKTCLDTIRNLCRKHHLDIWNKQSLSDLIYLDLLFIYHIPRLQREKILTLDLEFIMDGIVDNKITEEMIENTLFSWFNVLLSFKTDMDRSAVFKNLWSQLQLSEVKELFDGREFSMFSIEKDTKKSSYYYTLIRDIFEYMASITLESYDSNAGYTYFKKGLNKGTAKTFGQFYTPESVVQSVVNEIKPLSTETLLDPSCGSCSFMQGSAKFIKDNEKIDDNTIIFRNLYGIEVERNIYTEGIMSIFINFGILPDMKKNIVEEDAYIELLTKDTQYDVSVANPPFGADASTFSEFYYKTIIETTVTKTGKSRNKKIITINPEVKYEIPYPNTKESAVLFWQIIVQKLKLGGRAGVVMSATLLNDSNTDVMKWFLETCSLKKIIINPAGTFKDQGTSIETFSFIYTKGTPTTNVKIVMLGAEDVSVKELTLEQIRDAGWKIKIKDDTVKEVYTGKFELVELGDICNIINGKPVTTADKEIGGEYPVMGGGMDYVGNYSKYNREGDTISISKSGASSGFVKYHTCKYWAGDCFTILPKDATILIKYLYYYLKMNNSNILKKITGATIPHCKWDDIKDLKISRCPLPIQEKIVTNLDRFFANPQDMKEILAFTDRAMDLMLQDPTGAQLEDLVESIRLRRHHQTAANSVKHQMAAVMRSVSARGFERKKLSNICSVAFGERITQKNNTGTIYPVYGSGGDTFRTDSYNRTGKTCKLGRFAISEVNMVMFVEGPYWLMDSGFTVESKMKDILQTEFLWYLLLCDKRRLSEVSSGSCQKNIEMERFYQLEYPIPPLPVQTKILTILEEMKVELKTLEQMAAKAEERARFILDGYLSTPVEEEEETKPTSTPISNVLTHEPAEPDLLPAYESMTRSQLLEECKKKNLKGVSSKKKEDLIKMLESS